jgi:hypothetical protein
MTEELPGTMACYAVALLLLLLLLVHPPLLLQLANTSSALAFDFDYGETRSNTQVVICLTLIFSISAFIDACRCALTSGFGLQTTHPNAGETRAARTGESDPDLCAQFVQHVVAGVLQRAPSGLHRVLCCPEGAPIRKSCMQTMCSFIHFNR